MAYNHLIWNEVGSIPKAFTGKELDLIFASLLKSTDYWKSKNRKAWGDFLKTRDITIIATIYILALRPKEACKLKFDDFDFKQMTVRIAGTSNKTRKPRTIPIPKILMRFLVPYLEFPRSRFWKGSEYLFPSFQNPFISPERLKHIFREKALKPSKLWEMPKKGKYTDTRLYALRHTKATEIMNKQIEKFGQADLYAIANVLGHSDLRSTKIYLQKDQNYQEYMRGLLEY